MARKDLSRTVIEGGRYYGNSLERRASHGVERASTREWLDSVLDDVDEAEHTAPPPIKPVGKGFRDKLGPAIRWLASQVGRPWSKVYSELCDRFDSRTVAGRHVVQDHMLGWVRRHPAVGVQYHHRFELYVDAYGILRKPKSFGRAYQSIRREIESWASGRVCALTYRGLWWFRREMLGAACYDVRCRQHHFKTDRMIRYHKIQLVPVAPMTRVEVREIDRLTDYHRKQLVIPSPWPAR